MKEQKKKNEKLEQETTEVKSEEVAEAKVEDLEIDRDSMTDEEYISALETRLGQAIAEANECKSVAQRLQADFDNYRKRNASIHEDSKAIGQSAVIEKMLTVLDNCDLARKYLTDEAALTGFNMMETQILNALKGFGLEEVDAEGKDFDAKFMNAVEREKNEEMNGKVVSVLQKGYKLNGKLLRPAHVKVGYAE
ncbi:MAG: nucleotide exchange factor GrpE [Clostridia bacterium]|nr:nucleotide exchange factor GrpE [Clostridia bacterium]